ncbi:LMBRD1 [Blepharisma stoltei]|uniref:Lysosomal cobalamin transporter n=1 Tax=Blepharisma stoltei TaxID=1481888 RepID=A0AAU9JV91_9CILI|nr:unnamed protein product [Blepharisma stoltei]
MGVLFVAYCIFGTLMLLILFFNYTIVKYYTDTSEHYHLATVVTVLSLSITLFCVLLVPIDILIASGRVKDISDIDIPKETVRNIFLSLFSIMLLLAFMLIPFAYFYGEEQFDEIDSDGNALCEKICESMKYTASFMLICAVLVIVGLIFRPEKDEWGQGKEWIRQLFDVEHVGEAAISFTVACLTLVGLLLWCFYTAFGMAAMPFTLIKGKKSLEEAKNELEMDIGDVRDKIREIELRSAKSNTRMTRKEKRDKAKLEKMQKKLMARSSKISEKQKDSSQLLSRLLKFLTPFRVMLGVFALIFSLIFFFSLFFGAIDRLINSDCGFSCGFITSSSSIFNPLDSLLVYLSTMFPLDYLIFGLLILYIFIASIYGIVRWGIRFLCVSVFTIKKKRTMPQALLVASIIMMLVVLGISVAILTVVPAYTTFGSQKFVSDGKTVECSLENFNENECVMSNISSFFNRISLSIPLFSAVVYLMNWLFMAVFIVCGISAAMQKPSSSFEEELEIEEEEEETFI